ncbi:ATP-binding protein [Streptomyces europaeiscabiei]|uniref:ATP-binding protein n=1 Tax=Streptomyces europaeiscabiei TaxID=146819 RepID=UPI0038F684C5
MSFRSTYSRRGFVASRILADLASGHADRTWEKQIRELIRPDVLILDDIVMRQLSAAQADDLYELVSERQGAVSDHYQQQGSQRPVPPLPQPRRCRVPTGPAHQYQPPGVMNGPSYRPNKRPKNTIDKAHQGPRPGFPYRRHNGTSWPQGSAVVETARSRAI